MEFTKFAKLIEIVVLKKYNQPTDQLPPVPQTNSTNYTLQYAILTKKLQEGVEN